MHKFFQKGMKTDKHSEQKKNTFAFDCLPESNRQNYGSSRRWHNSNKQNKNTLIQTCKSLRMHKEDLWWKQNRGAKQLNLNSFLCLWPSNVCCCGCAKPSQINGGQSRQMPAECTKATINLIEMCPSSPV